MSTRLLVRRFVADYSRNQVNLVLLAVVPVVFVVVAGDALADAARLLGGRAGRGGAGVESVTAGWAAGFLAGVAMYFQVAASRSTDRRLVIAGLPRARLVAARLATGLILALVASASALIALALGQGIADPAHVVIGTAMFAIIYLALGALVGAVVGTPVNGVMIVLFVWIVDVFFGPTMSGTSSVLTRVLPTHFVSLWTVAAPSGHGGPDELVLSLAWTVLAVGGAFLVVLTRSSVARSRGTRRSAGSVAGQLRAGLTTSWRGWRRTPTFWVLLAVVPALFIVADAITPSGSAPISLRERGVRYVEMVDPSQIHAGTMAPIAVGSLAALASMFVSLDGRAGDRRLALAGQRAGVILATRLAMVLLVALVATGVSLAVTATVFAPRQWAVYATANGLVAVTYGLVGALLGPVLGRVSGAFMAFLIPFLDLGIGQSPMLTGEPAPWAHYMPGYGSIRVLLDGALTPGFDERTSLIIALAWVAALLLATSAVFARTASHGRTWPHRAPRRAR